MGILVLGKYWISIRETITRTQSMEGWTATKNHGVTINRNTKGLKQTGNLFRKRL